MLANNVVTILMIFFSWALVAAVAYAASLVVPRSLDRRRQRQIEQLTAGAELLADAIARHSGDAAHLARLSANYTAHATALTQLGQPVPTVPAEPVLAQAA
jgi:hypothetical protein